MGNTWFPEQIPQFQLLGDAQKHKDIGRTGGLASAAKRKAQKAQEEKTAETLRTQQKD